MICRTPLEIYVILYRIRVFESRYKAVVMNWAVSLESVMNPLSFCRFLMDPVEELEA